MNRRRPSCEAVVGINLERPERGDEFRRAVKDDPRYGRRVPTLRVTVAIRHVRNGRHKVVQCLREEFVGVIAASVAPRQERSNEDAHEPGGDRQRDVHGVVECADATGRFATRHRRVC